MVFLELEERELVKVVQYACRQCTLRYVRFYIKFQTHRGPLIYVYRGLKGIKGFTMHTT